MKLSQVPVDGVIRINKRLAIVRSQMRHATGIFVDKHGPRDYVWNKENPEVEYLGQGKLVEQIVLDN